jgi:tRNA-dihydrouridine synthase
MADISSKFSIAPTMELTDRHCRFFHRLLARRTVCTEKPYPAMISGWPGKLLSLTKRNWR